MGLPTPLEADEHIIPDSGIVEPDPISTRTALTYASGNLGGGIFAALNLYALPLFLKALGAPVIVNNLLSSTHSFEGTVIQPLVGAWSDRTWSERFGRRRIFIARFLPITVSLMLLTPFIPVLARLISGQATIDAASPAGTALLWAIAGSIVVFSLVFNIFNDPYTALLPDITPQHQRGQVNGIFQAVGAFGQVFFLILSIVLGVVLGLGPEALFVLAAVIMLVSFMPTLFGIHEPRELAGTKRNHRYTFVDYWNGLRRDPQVLLYFAVQLFLWIGINAISVNLTLYAGKVLKMDDDITFILPLVLLLSTALTYLPLIRLVNRIGLKRLYIFGIVLMAGSSVAAIFTQSVALTCVILAIAGVGNAAQTVSSFPLLTRIVFPDQMGLYTGLNTAVTSISAPLSAVIAGGLITIFSFTALFPFLSIMFLTSIIPLALLNVDRSHAAIALRAAQAAE